MRGLKANRLSLLIELIPCMEVKQNNIIIERGQIEFIVIHKLTRGGPYYTSGYTTNFGICK